MLVILMENQLLSPHQVCPSCLMASQAGQPRWRQGQLLCGRSLDKLTDNEPNQFECQMGFRIVNIE